MKKHVDFRLLDYKEGDVVQISSESKKYVKNYEITMFGKNESGKTAAITVQGFKPFFYVKVDEDWDDGVVDGFYKDILLPLRKEELKRNYDNWVKGKIDILNPPISKDDPEEKAAQLRDEEQDQQGLPKDSAAPRGNVEAQEPRLARGRGRRL